MDVAAGRLEIRREALVVLHVTGAGQLGELVGPLELGEHDRRRLAQHVDQHVQAAAVGHADHDLLDAANAALLDEVVEHRDQRVTAFQRKALLADVLGVQVALEALGRGELPEDVALLLRREAVVQHSLLEAVLQPQALLGLRHVGELRADVAAIDLPELRDHVAQLHAFRDAADPAAREELRVEVGLRQAEVGELQHPRHRPVHQSERVDVRDQVTAVGIDLDEARHRALLLGGLATTVRERGDPRSRGALEERALEGPMGNLGGRRGAEAVEIVPPATVHGLRVGEVLLVEILYIGRVRGEKRTGRVQLGERSAHGVGNAPVWGKFSMIPEARRARHRRGAASRRNVVPRTGVEPATCRLGGGRSIH
jgi:hypothetical protein